MDIKIAVILLIAVLVIFGPKNLPKLGKSLGSTVKSLREGMEEGDDDESEPLKAAPRAVDEEAEIRELEARLAAAKRKKAEAQEEADAE